MSKKDTERSATRPSYNRKYTPDEARKITETIDTMLDLLRASRPKPVEPLSER